MPAQLIERALAEWREGERLLRVVPRLDPDHDAVRTAVIRLRETYKELTELDSTSDERIARCRAQIDKAHRVITESRARLATSGRA